MTPESSPGEYPDRDPQMFYKLARERHAAQASSLDVLDNKLGLLLSTSSALLGILVAVYALRPDSFDAWALALLLASGAAWVVLAALAVHTTWHRSWRGGPDLQTVFDLHLSETDSKIKWRAANTFWHDYNHNKTHEKRKARALHWAFRLFIGQTVLLVAALALVAHDQRPDTTRRSECPAPAACDAQVLALAEREWPGAPDPDLLRSSAQGAPDLLRSSAQDLSA
jgi:hypothetical protein